MADAASVDGAPFGLTPQYLANAVVDCHTTASTIEAEITALRSYVEGLLAIWLGTAAGSFGGLMNDLSAYGNSLRQALDDIGDGIHSNYINYMNTEGAAVTGIYDLGVEIPTLRI